MSQEEMKKKKNYINYLSIVNRISSTITEKFYFLRNINNNFTQSYEINLRLIVLRHYFTPWIESKSDLPIFALLLFVWYIFIMFNPYESLGLSESELHVISSMLCTSERGVRYYWDMNCLPFRSTEVHPRSLVGYVVLNL